MFHQFKKGPIKMISFKYLDNETINRLQEIIVDKDVNKSAYLLDRYQNDPDKLDLGEKIYLKYFLYFEKEIIDDDGNDINIKNPYADKEEDIFRQLFNIMKAEFTLNYRSDIDNNSLEFIFANGIHKSLIFLEMNTETDTIMQTRLIIPLSKKANQSPNIEVFYNLPNNLYKVMDKHHPKEWPPIPSEHTPYLITQQELKNIHETACNEIEKNQMIFNTDMKKITQLENPEDIVGLVNILIAKSVILNSDKNTSITKTKK